MPKRKNCDKNQENSQKRKKNETEKKEKDKGSNSSEKAKKKKVVNAQNLSSKPLPKTQKPKTNPRKGIDIIVLYQIF